MYETTLQLYLEFYKRELSLFLCESSVPKNEAPSICGEVAGKGNRAKWKSISSSPQNKTTGK